jgi:hypothetical protein
MDATKELAASMKTEGNNFLPEVSTYVGNSMVTLPSRQ